MRKARNILLVGILLFGGCDESQQAHGPDASHHVVEQPTFRYQNEKEQLDVYESSSKDVCRYIRGGFRLERIRNLILSRAVYNGDQLQSLVNTTYYTCFDGNEDGFIDEIRVEEDVRLSTHTFSFYAIPFRTKLGSIIFSDTLNGVEMVTCFTDCKKVLEKDTKLLRGDLPFLRWMYESGHRPYKFKPARDYQFNRQAINASGDGVVRRERSQALPSQEVTFPQAAASVVEKPGTKPEAVKKLEPTVKQPEPRVVAPIPAAKNIAEPFNLDGRKGVVVDFTARKSDVPKVGRPITAFGTGPASKQAAVTPALTQPAARTTPNKPVGDVVSRLPITAVVTKGAATRAASAASSQPKVKAVVTKEAPPPLTKPTASPPVGTRPAVSRPAMSAVGGRK